MRRVPAEELELRYKLKHLMLDFFDEMKQKMRSHLEDKGFSWKSCSAQYLKNELISHVEKADWVDVANFCFMLDDKDKEKKK